MADETHKISPWSFTEYHQRLVDIVFGKIKLCGNVEPVTDSSCLTDVDLSRLAYMVQVEFAASLDKELKQTDSSERNYEVPHPFDVFLMEKNLARCNLDIAVCLPTIVSLPKPQSPQSKLMWHDAAGNIWNIDDPKTHIRKLTSLSGAARILESLLLGGDIPSLMEAAMSREMIRKVPDLANHCGEDGSLLNESQAQAVAAVASPDFHEGFLVIQGPPGTGKTTTMVEMIKAVGKHIIVTAPSNAAVANVALKLFATNAYNFREVCVFGENCHESVRFLSPIHRGRQHYEFRNKFDFAKLDEEKEKLRRSFAHWLHANPDTSTIESMAMNCPYINMENVSGRRFLKLEISSSRIIFCTLNTAGSPFLRGALCGRFHTLLLDEGGQCPEAEFYIATTVPGVQRIVVVGDPMQLPSTVIDPLNQKAGYGESWMGQVLKYCRSRVHLLNIQYRMDPAILFFPNRHFYSDQIRSGGNVYGRLPFVENPFQFVDTDKTGSQEKVGFSWRNSYEAAVIKSVIKTDPDIKRIRAADNNARIIIIAPYLAQTELLKSNFENVKGLGRVDVATVDSFQGQEGDIVIISTVRTKGVGFLDNRHRLNVALTRSRRILRIVGDAAFFLSLPMGSTLRNIALHAKNASVTKAATLKALAWRSPDWDAPRLWTVVLTQRFHYVIKTMTDCQRNICFNTLLAVAAPDIRALYARPVRRQVPSWQMSALTGYAKEIRIVWIAKPGSIEVHFAGPPDKCHHFIQTNNEVPAGACVVNSGLSRISLPETTGEEGFKLNGIQCHVWKMTNNLQSSLAQIKSLPQGSFCLDDHQSSVIAAAPPLLIESRSGTGKTNVLFQHAISHTSDTDMPVCFVTVSSRLSKELKTRFEEVSIVEGTSLPQVVFYSFRNIVQDLLLTIGDKVRNVLMMCTFHDYIGSRKAHSSLAVDITLMENEIGGVILGSLLAALQKAPLTLEQYMAEKRSNIGNSKQDDLERRRDVYKEFIQYQRWKAENKSFDISDIILDILDKDLGVYFESVYLDEVQDLSYASIFMILSIAGKDHARWICAGDTAQMISPGCSFTFDGLKQTMLAVNPGIEPKLSEVRHLLRNYRTTSDVLKVGNAILDVAKRYFPDSIEYAPPEVAMKDLFLKVVLCSWEDCFKVDVSLGSEQAFIFSSNSNTDRLAKEANQWLDHHPFVLSSLESKGLEFDDVIVAFEHERKTWKVETSTAASLRMLRELYVAVTRAKRRVVILVKQSSTSMVQFFKSHFDCDLRFIDADVIMKEFDSETSPEIWFEKGHAFFQNEKFKLATSCFFAAKNFGWSFWAQGLHESSAGERAKAVCSFRCSARHFFDAGDYKHTMDLFQLVKNIPPWDSKDNDLFERARDMDPAYFPRIEMVKFALVRLAWDEITNHDLKCSATAPLLYAYRTYPFLKLLVDKSSSENREAIEKIFPLAVGDWCLLNHEMPRAVRLYLAGGDWRGAGDTTVNIAKTCGVCHSKADMLETISLWNGQDYPDWANHLSLLLSLFRRPMETSAAFSNSCLVEFGGEVVKCAVRHAGLDNSCLHSFHQTVFAKDVLTFLEEKFKNNHLEIIRWFCKQRDMSNATDYCAAHLKGMTDNELIDVVIMELKLSPGPIFCELERRGMQVVGASAFLRIKPPAVDCAIKTSMLALDTPTKAAEYFNDLAAVWSTTECKTEAKKASMKPPKSKLVLLLTLVSDDLEAIDTGILKQSFFAFGKKTIYEFVLKSSPSILFRFDLTTFCSTHHITILEDLVKYGSTEYALRYAEQRATDWSVMELTKIALELKHRSTAIQDELERRKLYLVLVDISLEDENISRAEHYSDCALSLPSKTKGNIVRQLLQLWSTCPEDIIQSQFPSTTDGATVISGVWNLWKHPCHMTPIAISKLLVLLGPVIVQTVAVGHVRIDYQHMEQHVSELKDKLSTILHQGRQNHSPHLMDNRKTILKSQNVTYEPSPQQDRKTTSILPARHHTGQLERGSFLNQNPNSVQTPGHDKCLKDAKKRSPIVSMLNVSNDITSGGDSPRVREGMKLDKAGNLLPAAVFSEANVKMISKKSKKKKKKKK